MLRTTELCTTSGVFISIFTIVLFRSCFRRFSNACARQFSPLRPPLPLSHTHARPERVVSLGTAVLIPNSLPPCLQLRNTGPQRARDTEPTLSRAAAGLHSGFAPQRSTRPPADSLACAALSPYPFGSICLAGWRGREEGLRKEAFSQRRCSRSTP